MSERKTECTALVVTSSNYPAQLQTAGRQLAIAAQLNDDLNRRRFVTILKRISSKAAIEFLSNSATIGVELIERYEEEHVAELDG